MEANLDETDLKILKILQQDGRISNKKLSGLVGLSPAPTLERVKKLENSGIIRGFHALINQQQVGLGISALIQISLVRQIDNAINNFKGQIKEIDEITECYQVTGNFDYLLKAVVPDIPAFEKLIAEKLSKIEEIGQMHTNVILGEVKKRSTLPLQYPNGQ